MHEIEFNINFAEISYYAMVFGLFCIFKNYKDE